MLYLHASDTVCHGLTLEYISLGNACPAVFIIFQKPVFVKIKFSKISSKTTILHSFYLTDFISKICGKFITVVMSLAQANHHVM